MISAARSAALGLSDNARGSLWIIVGGFFFTVMVALIKEVGDVIPVVQILFFRQVTMMITVAPILLANRRDAFRTKHPGLHTARVALAMVAMVLGFTAVVHLPLAEATALGFSKTMFVTLFAVWFLQEVAGTRRWTVVGVGFVGVLIMLRPASGVVDVYAVLALISAAAAGAIMVIIRKVAQDDRPVTILAIQAVFVGILMSIPCAIFWVDPSPEQWLMMVAIGVVSAIGQYCNIRGFKSGEASAVAPMEYMRLVFAIALGFAIFSEAPDWATLLGALLIAGSSIYAIRAEHLEQTMHSQP